MQEETERVAEREEEQEAEDRGEHKRSPSENFIRIPRTMSFLPFPQTLVVSLPAAFLGIFATIVGFIARLYQNFIQLLSTTTLWIDMDYQLNSGSRRLSG